MTGRAAGERNRMRTTLRNRATMLWCAAIVLLAAMPALLLPAGAGWITDNGNKYIIMRSLAEGGTTAIANRLEKRRRQDRRRQ